MSQLEVQDRCESSLKSFAFKDHDGAVLNDTIGISSWYVTINLARHYESGN